MLGLEDALEKLDSYYDGFHFRINYNYYGPGFITAMTASLLEWGVAEQLFSVHSTNAGYFTTLGLYRELWGTQANICRPNAGVTYSQITPLRNAEQVDQATTTINSCIRCIVQENTSQGINDLLKVVGELHDNVWSHGKSTGFSMAQKWAIPNTNQQDHYLEFALADRGLGFLGEMNRARKTVLTDREAIEWCIIEGNSTKHASDERDLDQRLPEGHDGVNPMGQFACVMTENHHQGLGLAYLIKLVKKYDGELNLASGSCLLTINSAGENFKTISNPWKGVAISCRFKESSLLREVKNDGIKDEKIAAIMQRLKGG